VAGDRSHDTDPLADTATSDQPSSPESPSKKRAVHVGDTLGRYELVEEVGEGGMATVFRARDKELRREVAIKVLFPHLARRPEVVRRFQREARAAATLEHENILRIYDVGNAEGEDPPYIVMELIRGRSLLGELEQRGPMLAEIAACLGAVLADALGAAHKAGIIHRDVKPANVMIASDGRVLLADFGVARLETEDSLVTKTGALLGTPAYMSPEQASGDTATARSDLYSLGATLYQLATGSLPYTGSPAKVMASIAQGSLVPAVKRRSAVGPDLSAAIGKMMATDPEARPASAADVTKDLRAIAAAAGFGDPHDELTAYFADPDAFVRAKTPSIVTSIVTAAKGALGESKLPRAMALADRATALAPEDPAVKTLVESVTEGGRSSQRRKLLAGVAIASCLVAGTVAGVRMLRGGSHAAAIDARVVDGAAGIVGADAVVLARVDAATSPDALAPAADALATRDASTADAAIIRVDARVRIDAASVALAADAAVVDAMAIDARPLVPVDAPPEMGKITVVNDTWCDVSIDGGAAVRNAKQAFAVTAGHHTVVCAQSADRRWSRDVEVKAGETTNVRGQLLADVAVTLGIDAAIDGIPHRRGEVVRVKAGVHDLEAGPAKIHASISAACTVRDNPLDCYAP
jgi:serine/threonine-protein kinase